MLSNVCKHCSHCRQCLSVLQPWLASDVWLAASSFLLRIQSLDFSKLAFSTSALHTWPPYCACIWPLLILFIMFFDVFVFYCHSVSTTFVFLRAQFAACLADFDTPHGLSHVCLRTVLFGSLRPRPVPRQVPSVLDAMLAFLPTTFHLLRVLLCVRGAVMASNQPKRDALGVFLAQSQSMSSFCSISPSLESAYVGDASPLSTRFSGPPLLICVFVAFLATCQYVGFPLLSSMSPSLAASKDFFHISFSPSVSVSLSDS